MFLPSELTCEVICRTNVNTLGKFMLLSRNLKSLIDQNVGEICYKVFAALATYTPTSHHDSKEKHLIRAKKHIHKLIRREKTITNLLKLRSYNLEVLDQLRSYKFSSWINIYKFDETIRIKKFAFTGTQAIIIMKGEKTRRETLLNTYSRSTAINSKCIPYFSKSELSYHFPFESDRIIPCFDRKKEYVKLVGKFLISYWNAATLDCVFATDRSHPVVDIHKNFVLYLKEPNQLSLWDIQKRKEAVVVNLPCEVTQFRGILLKDKCSIWVNDKTLYSIQFTPNPTVSLIFDAPTELKGSVLTSELIFPRDITNTFVVDTKAGRVVHEFIDLDFIGRSGLNIVLANCYTNELKILSQQNFETKFTIQAKSETSIGFCKNKLVLIDENLDHTLHIDLWNIDTGEKYNYFDIKEMNYKFQKTMVDAHILVVLLQNDKSSQCCIFIDLATGRYLARKYITDGDNYSFRLSQLAYTKSNWCTEGFVIENFEG